MTKAREFIVWWYQDTAEILLQAGRDFVQFLVELPGFVWQSLCILGNVLLVLSILAGFILLGLWLLYALFFSSPAPPRALLTSDLWWLAGFWLCMAGAMHWNKN